LDRIEAKVLEPLIRMYPWKSIRFSFLKELSDEAADSLSSVPLDTNVSVSVGTLTEMSPKAAELFRKHRGWFVFPETVEGKVTVQSDGMARTVATGAVRGAFFADLQTLGAVSARLLAKYHHETLYLDSLRTLNKYEANELSAHKERISFNGLEPLEEGESFHLDVAALLLRCAESATEIGPGMLQGALQKAALRVNELLKLSQLECLTDETARLLSGYPGSIYLSAVSALSSGQAENLSAHQGGALYLGIKTIDKGIATSLAKHEGKSLSFLSLEELSDEAAVALAKYPGVLHFPALIEASPQARVALSKHQGEITFSEEFDRGNPAEDPFFQARGWYPEKKVYSDMTAQTFASKGSIEKDIPLPNVFLRRIGENFDRENAAFYLDGRTTLTDEELEWIAGFKGTISLRGITSIGPREASYFNRALSMLIFDRNVAVDEQTYVQMEEYWDGQFTHYPSGIVPYAVLRYRFARHKTDSLLFQETESMDEGLIKALEGYEGDISVSSPYISLEALKLWAKTRGNLSLNELTDFPKEAVPFFRGREGRVALRYLTFLSEEVAQLLVDQDQELWFSRLEQLSASVVRILAKNKKDIHLPGIREMHVEDMKLLTGMPERTVFLDNLMSIQGDHLSDVMHDASFSLRGYMKRYETRPTSPFVAMAGGGRASSGSGKVHHKQSYHGPFRPGPTRRP
ncbi:hypothetical protein KBA73_05220, partial [Patescibacteria group bacterium]|nr:hypothetical protein [Patescibacteria group bacterium]